MPVNAKDLKWGPAPAVFPKGADLAVISGITRQQKLYEHLGFVPFGPLIGTREAQFQPMMLTLERFRPRAHTLFGRVE